MRDFGGMISIVLKDADRDETFRIASSFHVFSLAESLGGVESLINHPVTMTHASIPKEERERVGVVDNLLRLSVGVEDIEDILEDLRQAFGVTNKNVKPQMYPDNHRLKTIAIAALLLCSACYSYAPG